MTIQITIRISDESAAYIDGLVEAGKAKSRAAYVDKIVRRQKRRERAVHDALIYAQQGEDPELVAFSDAAYASRFGATVPTEDRRARESLVLPSVPARLVDEVSP